MGQFPSATCLAGRQFGCRSLGNELSVGNDHAAPRACQHKGMCSIYGQENEREEGTRPCVLQMKDNSG